MHLEQPSDQSCHPQEWMDNSMELEEDEEFIHRGEGNQCDQILTYLMEIHKILQS